MLHDDNELVISSVKEVIFYPAFVCLPVCVSVIVGSDRSSIIVDQDESIVISSFISKPQCVKGDWGRKSRPNFELFDPLEN